MLMSSAYPPPGNQLIRRCFRCGTPLPPNGTICGSCGAYNALPRTDWGTAQGQVQPPPQGFATWGQPPAAAVPGAFAQPAQPAQQAQPFQFQPSPFVPTGAGMPATGQHMYSQGLMHTAGNRNGYYQGWQGMQGMTNGFTPGFPATSASFDYYQPQQQKRSLRTGLMILIGVLILLVAGGGLTGWLYFSSNNQGGTSPTSTFVVTTPSVKPLFHDSFTNNSTGWLVTTDPGKFSTQVGGGHMTLEDNDNKLLWNILPGKLFADFRLDVDARLAKGNQNNAYGVYIRGASSPNSDIGTYYRLELYGDGTFAIYKGTLDSNGNTLNTLVKYASNAAILQEGQVNHITIIAQGSSMVFIVNGVTIDNYNDTSYKSGLVALFVSNLPKLPPGAQATFANLAIFPVS
jgi:3-keto-disaccharide hydrolase